MRLIPFLGACVWILPGVVAAQEDAPRAPSAPASPTTPAAASQNASAEESIEVTVDGESVSRFPQEEDSTRLLVGKKVTSTSLDELPAIPTNTPRLGLSLTRVGISNRESRPKAT